MGRPRFVLRLGRRGEVLGISYGGVDLPAMVRVDWTAGFDGSTLRLEFSGVDVATEGGEVVEADPPALRLEAIRP